MITVVIANSHILVDDKLYVSLDYEAYSENGEIGLRHINQKDLSLIKGRVAPDGINLNGVTYATGPEFVAAFNALTSASSQAKTDANTSYPDSIISVVLTPNTARRITEHAKPGYVTIYNPGANTGDIYVGGSNVAAGSYAIEPGKSFPIESSDLSTWYVKNAVADEQVFIGGSYKA